MITTKLCRTCGLQKESIFELIMPAAQYIHKTWSDLVEELIKIDVTSDANIANSLPQQLCDICCEKLLNAYDFVTQARKVNDKLLMDVRSIKYLDCLTEPPIDIPQGLPQVKMEIDAVINSATVFSTAVQSTKTVEIKDTKPIISTIEQNLPKQDPIILSNAAMSISETPHVINDNKCVLESENSSDNDFEDIPLIELVGKQKREKEFPQKATTLSKSKRTVGRPRLSMKPNVNKEGRFVCKDCGKTFAWFKDMQRHAKSHFEAATYECEYCNKCFLRKDKYNDHKRIHEKQQSPNNLSRKAQMIWIYGERIYSCSPCQIMECKLCGMCLSTKSDLRKHILSHNQMESLAYLSLDNECIKEFFSHITELEQVKLAVCADINAQCLYKYYSLTNEYGYEQSLTDNEIGNHGAEIGDDNDDTHYNIEEKLRNFHYICELCNEDFKSQHDIFRHTKEHHSHESLPYCCNVCKLGFVCLDFYEQHLRIYCRSKEKKYQCLNCPGKFMWASNLENHNCYQTKANVPSSIKHNCKECNESFSKYKQYKIHMEMHDETKRSNDQQQTEHLAHKLQCDQCDKVFIWPKDLTRHKLIHMPDREKFQCTICARKFNRKDNLQAHLKVHGDDVTNAQNSGLTQKPSKVNSINANWCKPHGCKLIECMICRTKHTKIADLRTHLRTHQYSVNFPNKSNEDLALISRTLYPEEPEAFEEEVLTKRIMADIANQCYERFYSITNEAGYELSLDSTESDTDSETEVNVLKQKYNCELCSVYFERKYQLFKHQEQEHSWQEAPHVCMNCQARFVNATVLEQHYQRLCKNPQKKLECRKCAQRFQWKHNYKLHLEAHYDEENAKRKQNAVTYECNQCKRSYKMQKDLTRHMFMHMRDGASYTCNWCPRKFYRQGNLLQHIERHGITANELPYAETLIAAHKHANGRKVIQCKLCNQQFLRLPELRTHLQCDHPDRTYTLADFSITNELGFELDIDDSETEDECATRQYECILCHLICKRKYELFRHQHAMHKQEAITLKCPHCIFKCVSQDLMAYHIRTQCENLEKQLKCVKCNYKFMWSDNLQAHMHMQHKDDETKYLEVETSIDTTMIGKASDNQVFTIFQCNQCPCKYNRKDRLSAHIRKIHSTTGSATNKKRNNAKRIDPVTGELVKKEAEKLFLCAFCGKAVSSSSNLIIHMRRHTGEKPFKCDFCDMAFPRSSDMQCHRRTHTGEKPHLCTVCNKAFSRSYKLLQHMRIHNGERPYKCTYCERSFTQSNDLTLHVRRHTGERPYVCGVCGEGFIQGTALKNHRIMRGHREEVESPVRRTVLEQFYVK